MKTLDNFKIVTKSGQIYDMSEDLNILVQSFIVSSPNPEIIHEKLDGQHGVVRIDKTWGQRKIMAKCSAFSVDPHDISLLRSEVFKALMSIEEFFIVSDADPGKQWLVEVGSEWSPEKLGIYSEFTLNFVSHSSFAQSVGTTLSPFTFDAEIWQIGQGIVGEDLIYSHSTSEFSIYNGSDIEIDPRQLPLKIEFKGPSQDLKITNTTTSDTWAFTGQTIAEDTIVLDGIRTLKNGASAFGNTNKKLITLAAGWNDFTITGATDPFTISFDFRFYTL